LEISELRGDLLYVFIRIAYDIHIRIAHRLPPVHDIFAVDMIKWRERGFYLVDAYNPRIILVGEYPVGSAAEADCEAVIFKIEHAAQRDFAFVSLKFGFLDFPVRPAAHDGGGVSRKVEYIRLCAARIYIAVS
jgi:hypothetical protein